MVVVAVTTPITTKTMETEIVILVCHQQEEGEEGDEVTDRKVMLSKEVVLQPL